MAIGCLIFLGACSAPKTDLDSEEGRQAFYQAVRNHLTAGRCGDAIYMIDPVYTSSHTNSEVRSLRASAHGCKAGVNFFEVVSRLSDSTNYPVTGTAFWKTMPKLFASTSGDGKMEASWYALDALMAIWNSGTSVPAAYQVTRDSYNTGSIRNTDVTDDANAYRVFVAMATLGTTQNRYGLPDSSYNKTQDLPWLLASGNMDSTGCGFASAVLTLLDSIDIIVNQLSGSLKDSLSSISLLRTGLDAQCVVDNGVTCSSLLRDRDSCTSSTAARDSAYSVVKFVNTTGWI